MSVAVHVPIERLREHGRRMRRRWLAVGAICAVVFAVDLAIQHATEGMELGIVALAAIVVAQFGGGAGLVAAIATLFLIRRRMREKEGLDVEIDGGRVTVVRGDVVVHDGARLVAVRAFEDWVQLVVDRDGEEVPFAVPVEGEDRDRLLAGATGGAPDRLPPRGRAPAPRAFVPWALARIAGATSAELLQHLLVHLVVLAIVVAVLGGLVGLVVASPAVGGLVAAIAALAVLVAAGVRFAAWARTPVGRAGLRGVAMALALATLHAAGWALAAALGPPPRDYDSSGSFALATFAGLAVLGAVPGIPWGLFVGLFPLARPRWPRAAFVALAVAPLVLISVVLAARVSAAAALAVLPATALAALGALVLAPRRA
jgi:hypothetical protein